MTHFIYESMISLLCCQDALIGFENTESQCHILASVLTLITFFGRYSADVFSHMGDPSTPNGENGADSTAPGVGVPVSTSSTPPSNQAEPVAGFDPHLEKPVRGQKSALPLRSSLLRTRPAKGKCVGLTLAELSSVHPCCPTSNSLRTFSPLNGATARLQFARFGKTRSGFWRRSVALTVRPVNAVGEFITSWQKACIYRALSSSNALDTTKITVMLHHLHLASFSMNNKSRWRQTFLRTRAALPRTYVLRFWQPVLQKLPCPQTSS